MNRITPAMLTLLMFGVITVLVAGYVAKNMFAAPDKPRPPGLRDIPLAIADIKPGTIVTEKHLGLGKIRVDELKKEMLLSNRVIVGRAAKKLIKSAEPIISDQLYQPGELAPLEISPGMRAETIEVSDVSSMVDGLIKPGDHVDVLFTAVGGYYYDIEVAYQGGLTMRLFEGVKILAINRSITQGALERTSNRVTLELSDKQANVIPLAVDKGKITLSYNPNGKGSGDIALSSADRVTFYELLGLVPGKKPKEPLLTEIYRGTSRQTQYYDEFGRYLNRPYFSLDPSRQRTQYVLPQAAPTQSQPAPTTDPVIPAPSYQMPTTSLPNAYPANSNPSATQNRVRMAPTAALMQTAPK